MITCPNCNHQNPDGALQCEACYTPLPALATCPNCQAPVQADSSFCGQCGSDLRDSAEPTQNFPLPNLESSTPDVTTSNADLPESVIATSTVSPSNESTSESFSEFSQSVDLDESVDFSNFEPSNELTLEPNTEPGTEPTAELESTVSGSAIPTTRPEIPTTQLQATGAVLKHVQTEARIAVPSQLSVVRIGKPNNSMPPDIDVSGLPDSEIVSRVHANLLIEGEIYYLEDMGSSNGTYINALPLPVGNRHRLNTGDRIALGKGDKVSFIFELGK